MAGAGRLHDHPGPSACGRGPKRGLRDPALGRSRGTSKIHLARDGRGRPLAFLVTGRAFDREAYKHRNVVERCFYDKTAQPYEAAVTLASLLMWA
jgi:hypothetical protein